MIKNKIVLVPFPFDDFTAAKVRPALCLSDSIGRYHHVVIAFISSNTAEPLLPTDLLLAKGAEEFAGSGLAVSSVVRIHKMITVPKGIIQRELGAINAAAQQEVKKRLFILFDA